MAGSGIQEEAIEPSSHQESEPQAPWSNNTFCKKEQVFRPKLVHKVTLCSVSEMSKK